MNFGFVEVPAIAAICYFAGMACKAIDGIPDKLIPVIVGALGGILGAVAFLTGMPDFPASDILTAIAVGIVSGSASTWVNQLTRQLKNNPDDEVMG